MDVRRRPAQTGDDQRGTDGDQTQNSTTIKRRTRSGRYRDIPELMTCDS
jgi:hypothetical protein